MATTTFSRSSAIGADEIKQSIAAYLGDSDMDLDEVLKDVQNWVNNELPGSYSWHPYTSELIADVEEDEMSEEELMEYITQGIAECANDPDEELCSSLTDATRMEIRKKICLSLLKDTDDAEDLFDQPNPEDTWDLDHKLVKKMATVREYREEFIKFYGSYMNV